MPKKYSFIWDKFKWAAFLLVLMGMTVCISKSFSNETHARKEQAPYFDAVMKVLAPLRYSGLDDILGPDSNISVDFSNKIFTLNNRHLFNREGDILLHNGTDGECDELSRYVYKRIKPIFPQDLYAIRFSRVTERNYFFVPGSVHLVIVILDKRRHQSYLLDPSFKKYGRKEDIKGYSYFEDQDPEAYIRNNMSPDKTFGIKDTTPLFIRDGYLVSFTVLPVNGIFDKDHFILAIMATARRSDISEYVLGVRHEGALAKIGGGPDLLRNLLNPEETYLLMHTLIKWNDQISR